MEKSNFQIIDIENGEETKVNGIKLIFSKTTEGNFLKLKQIYSFR